MLSHMTAIRLNVTTSSLIHADVLEVMEKIQQHNISTIAASAKPKVLITKYFDDLDSANIT